MVACGEWGQRLADRLAFAKVELAFTCYHSVCSTCHFLSLRKPHQQSDTENIVRGVKKPVRAYNVSICVSYANTYFKSRCYTHNNDKIWFSTHSANTISSVAGICQWQEWWLRGKVSFRCLNYGSSPPFCCHHLLGRARQKEGNVSSLLPWYFKFRRDQEDIDKVLLQWREEEGILMFPLFPAFFFTPFFAVVFKYGAGIKVL